MRSWPTSWQVRPLTRLRNKASGVQVTVAEEKAEALVASGTYEPIDQPKRTTRRTKKTEDTDE